jgi:hypothetical protein
VLALAHVLDLFVDELAGLCRRRLARALVLARPLDGLSIWHDFNSWEIPTQVPRLFLQPVGAADQLLKPWQPSEVQTESREVTISAAFRRTPL